MNGQEEKDISNRSLLLQQFRDFHDYIHLMGENIIQIHGLLDKIEKDIDDMKKEHNLSIEKNRELLSQVKEIMVAKSEIEAFLQELDSIIKRSLPSLPIATKSAVEEERAIQEVEEEIEVQKEPNKSEGLKEEQKIRKRFGFF